MLMILAGALAASCGTPRRQWGSSGSDGDGGSSTHGSGGSPTTHAGSGGGDSGGSGASGGSGGGVGAVSSSSSSGAGATGAGGSGAVCDAISHTCVPETPPGWTGPVALHEGPEGTPSPACVGDYATTFGEFNGDLDEGMATCSCTCDPAQGIACTSPAGLCYGSNCTSFCAGTDETVAPGVCKNIAGSASSSVRVTSPLPTQMGSCAPNPDHTITTPVWGTAAKACGGAAASPVGCGAGDVCVPNAVAPFATMCVVHDGDVACPSSYFGEKHLFHEGFDDTRACSGCSCGGATSTCGGSVVFTEGGCNNVLLSTVAAGGCGPLNSGGSAENARYTPTPSGTCPPSGGALSGAVVETGTKTFCCH
jgi:hypothetical protein